MSITNPPRGSRGFRLTWSLIRLATAAALITAIVAQVFATISYAQSQSHDVATALANHFSYFTVLSTSAGAVVLTIGGVWLAAKGTHGEVEPRWLSVLFLAIGVAVVVTGLVFNLLLRNDGVPDPDTLTWASEIKHVVAPLVFACDLALGVARGPLKWSDIGVSLIYPIAWVTYTLIRAELVIDPMNGTAWWYPYGFLDPHRSDLGYFSVALYVVAIAAIFAVIAALTVWNSRRLRSLQRRPFRA